MEKEAFQRCLDNIINKLKLPVRLISTDRHLGIKALLKSPPYRNIKHQFDAWHVAKSVLKKLIVESKKNKGILVYHVKVAKFKSYSVSTILTILSCIELHSI